MPISAAGGVIRIVFAKNPPDAFTTCNNFPTMIPSVDCPFPGWLVEVVRMLADYLNLQIEPIIIDSSIGNVNWGHQFKAGEEHRHHQGNWSGILGILEQGVADTVCTVYPYTEHKAQYFNFSHPVTGVRDIYIAKPKRRSLSVSVWNAFFPYEPKLWFLLLLFLAIQCGVASLVSNMEFRLNLRPKYAPLEKVWQYLRLQIHQATEFQTPFLLQSGNLAFVFYALIQATLFTQLYTAVLLSALIRGETSHPWDNYNEMIRLIKNQEYSVVLDKHHLEKDNSFYETLSYRYKGMSHLRNLADALETNPIRVVDDISQALDIVERGGFILPTKQHSLAFQLSKERCDLFYYEDDHNQMPTFFLFSQHSKLLRDWNRAIQNNQAFIRRTYEKYFFHDFNTGNIPNCKRRTSAEEEEEELGASADRPTGNSARDASRSLDFESTFGIFLIAIIGFSLALLVFICELLVHAKARRLNRKWRTRRALVMANPTHLMAIAGEMRARRVAHADSQSSDGPVTDKQMFMMAPAALLHANSGPPRLDRAVGRSWWRPKVREPSADPSLRRQRSIISAVTLAAISAQSNAQQQRRQDDGHANMMELRQRPGWAMLGKKEDGEDQQQWERTAF